MSRHAGSGEGTVYYEKSRNKWVASTTDSSGRKITKRFGSEKEAKSWLQTIRAQMTLGTYQSPTKITLEQWIADYLMTYKAKTVRPKTMLRYFNTANQLKDISHIKLEDLTTHKLQQFFNKQNKLSYSSLVKIQRLLNAALEKAVACDALIKNPMLGVELPQVERPQQVLAFTDEQIDALLNAAASSRYYKWLLSPIELALYCGLRLGEVFGLRVQDVGYDSNSITICNSLQAIGSKLIDSPLKTEKSYRTIGVPKEIIDRLPHPKDGYIFHTKDGNAISPNNFHRAWAKLLNEAGLDTHLHFHALRHTHATKLIAAGVPIPNVSRRLGHSNITTTLNIYTHPDETAERTLLNLVATMVATKPKKV